MKTRRLRKFVIPTVYTLTIVAFLISIVLIGKTINSFSKDNFDSYVVNGLVKDDNKPVMNYTQTKAIKPFTDEKVVISKNFYDSKADEKTQEQSLIYYENTYMQNSGILYTAENPYDVVAVLDGKVTEVKTDEILGNVITIEHDNDLKTVYQSVGNVEVKVNDEVKQGTKIATSGENKLENTNKNCLLFEVYQKGQLLNPEKFYEMDLKASEQ